MHKLPNLLTNLLTKQHAKRVHPNLDGDGNQFNDEADLAKRWTEFLGPKFTMLPKPKKLHGYPSLPPKTAADSIPPSVKTKEKVLARLRNHRATGPDDTPIEPFKCSTAAKPLSFELMDSCYQHESTPPDMATGRFAMLHKKVTRTTGPTAVPWPH